MIIRQIISVLAVLAFTGTASAEIVKVDLKVGLIKPGETIVITLDQLVPAVVYKLSCVLTSDHASGKAFDVVQVTTPTNSQRINVNAAETAPGSHQYNLPTNKNTYVTGNIYKDIGDISITNLDGTDAVLLSSCHAVGRI